MPETRHINVNYDPEAQVWWAESDDLPGLVSEALTIDALIERVSAVAGELLSLNGAAPGTVRLEFLTTREVETSLA